MKIRIIAKACLILISISIIPGGLVFSAEKELKPSIRLTSLNLPPGFDQARLESVGKKIGFLAWPKTELVHVAPRIDTSLISKPKLVTRKSTSYDYVQFDDALWGKYNLSWGSLVEKELSPPLRLPPDREERLLKKLSDGQRKNPDFVKEYLRHALDRYKSTQKYRLDGELNIEVCLTPSSRSAHEYMLTNMIDSTMPPESLINMYKTAKRPEGLGNVSFLTQSMDGVRIKFARDNIYISIRANGILAGEALFLAKKIDDMIARQPSLSYKWLLAQRPSVTIGPKSKGKRAVSYDISSRSTSQEIVAVRAYIDDQYVEAKDGFISLKGKKGKARIKLIAFTRELLVNSFERELLLDE